MTIPKIPRLVSGIDWGGWTPVDKGTLLFVVRDGKVLLIHKKRGLGAGKVNGPGGRIDEGETPREGAVREVHEELGVEATGVEHRGELKFQFVDGYSIHVWVFVASGERGEAVETEEAVPLWTRLDEIPYERMWQDDRIWLPVMLKGEFFSGRFIFDGERMLDHEMTVPATFDTSY